MLDERQSPDSDTMHEAASGSQMNEAIRRLVVPFVWQHDAVSCSFPRSNGRGDCWMKAQGAKQLLGTLPRWFY